MLISSLLFVNIRVHSWLKFFGCGSLGTEINETLENAAARGNSFSYNIKGNLEIR